MGQITSFYKVTKIQKPKVIVNFGIARKFKRKALSIYDYKCAVTIPYWVDLRVWPFSTVAFIDAWEEDLQTSFLVRSQYLYMTCYWNFSHSYGCWKMVISITIYLVAGLLWTLQTKKSRLWERQLNLLINDQSIFVVHLFTGHYFNFASIQNPKIHLFHFLIKISKFRVIF